MLRCFYSYLYLFIVNASFMSVIIILIGISLLVAAGFLIAFLWAVRNGQYEDSYTPSVRILFDDEKSVPEPPEPKSIDLNKEKSKK